MGLAKHLVIKPIKAGDAAKVVKALHYSGKTAASSRLHFGVFLDGQCGGAIQFGDPIDKRKLLGLVSGTSWNGMLELNRMALADWLPANSESRALSVCFRIIRASYPQIEWIVSFADATQCGDGTIYRAAGFILTGIVKNKTLYRLNSGEVIADLVTRQRWNESTRRRLGFKLGETFSQFRDRVGAKCIPGHQLRYVYFLAPAARSRLTVPEIPFSEIERRGCRMYRGKRVGSADSGTSG